MVVKWSLYKISNCEAHKSRKWCRWEDASNFSSCPDLKRQNRVVSVYVAPACQAARQVASHPPKPSSSRRGRRLQRRRWRAACGRSEDGHDEVCEMGRGWFLGEDGTPCPSLPCPDHCLTLPAWAPLESNLQSDTHTQRGRVWGRAPKKGKKDPSEKKIGQIARDEHNVEPAKFLPTDSSAGPGEGEWTSFQWRSTFYRSTFRKFLIEHFLV